MRTALTIGILGLVLAGAARAGEKEAKEVLERAIKAHGGAAALARAAQLERTDKGTHSGTAFTSKVIRGLPDRVRLTIDTGGNKIVFVLNGERGWQSDGGPAAEIAAGRLAEMREEAYVDWVATLVPLTKSGFTLSSLPKTKVGGAAAVGIKVVRKGQPELRLYFLESSGLLVKIEHEGKLAGLKVDKESLFSDYKSFDGLKLPTKRTELVNGKKLTEFTSGDISFPKRLDAKTFAKP
jgi:hypothetical protein